MKKTNATGKPKIVHVIYSLLWGGTEGQVSRLSCDLQDSYSISFITLIDGGWSAHLKENGIEVNLVHKRMESRISRTSIRGLRNIIRILRATKPDIINGYNYPLSIWTSIAGFIAGVPVRLAHRRDCGFQRDEIALPRWIERLSYLVTTRFIANSQAVADSLTLKEGIDPARITIIHNGVDIPEYPSVSHDIRNGFDIPSTAFVVGMTGNFWFHKNQLQLIEAAKTVIAENKNVFFLLAGRDSPYQEIVRDRICFLNLESHVHIVGELKSTSEFNANIDVGVLCSRTEGLSNTILEYMAHGKPVIATNVGGNPELVIDQVNGYLVELDDADELAQAILTLSRDPEKCREMGAQSYTRAQALFNWNDGVDRWDNLYQSLLK